MLKNNKNNKKRKVEHFLPSFGISSLIPGFDSLIPNFGDIFDKIIPDFGGFGLSSESIKQCSILCLSLVCLLILFLLIGKMSPNGGFDDYYVDTSNYDFDMDYYDSTTSYR